MYLNRGLLLSGNVLDRDLNVLLGEVHLSSESAVWLPLAGSARSALLQHLVDLLESKTLGLGNEEVGEEDCLHISRRSVEKQSGEGERERKDLQEMQQREPHRKKTLDPRRAESSRSATR